MSEPQALTGERLRNLRMICGLTPPALAAMLGYGERQLRRFETGESPIPDELTGRLKPILLAHMEHVRLSVQDSL